MAKNFSSWLTVKFQKKIKFKWPVSRGQPMVHRFLLVMEEYHMKVCACTKAPSVLGTLNDTKSIRTKLTFASKQVFVSHRSLLTQNVLELLQPDFTTVCRETFYYLKIFVFLFQGEILIWDFREQDSLIARVTERQDLHRDVVSSLQWIREAKISKKKLIVSWIFSTENIFHKTLFTVSFDESRRKNSSLESAAE